MSLVTQNRPDLGTSGHKPAHLPPLALRFKVDKPRAMRERIRRNISYKFLGEAGSRAVGFAFNLLLARGLGAATYGRYSYAYAFAGLVALCGELGINTLITREIAHDRERAPELLRRFAPLRLASAALVALSTGLLALGFADRSRLLEIALMSVFTGATTLIDYNSAVFSAFERMGQEALMRVVARIAVSGSGIAAVLLGTPLVPTIGVIAGVNFLAALGGWAYRKRLGIAFGATWDPSFIRATLSKLLPMTAASMAGVVYFYMDSLLLKGLGFDDASIGQYSAASRILEASHALPLVIAGGLFPVAAELSHHGDPAALAPLFSRVARLALLFAAPLAAVSAVLSPFAAGALYGPGYAETGSALALLALSAPLYYSNLVSLTLFMAMGRLWTTAIVRAAAVTVKLAALLLASRWAGAQSPAVGMLVADSALFLFLLAYRTRHRLSEPGERTMVLSGAATSAATLLVYLAVRGRGIPTETAAVGAAFVAVYAAVQASLARRAQQRSSDQPAAADPVPRR